MLTLSRPTFPQRVGARVVRRPPRTFRGAGLGFPFEQVGTAMLLGSLALIAAGAYLGSQYKKRTLRGARRRR